MADFEPDYNKDEIDRIIEEHGTVPPLWAAFPGVHPYDICWRMGSGESYKYLYWAWWKIEAPNLSESQRIQYFKRFPPPYCWLTHMIDQIWDLDPHDLDGEDPDAFDYSPYFKRTDELGFGSEKDYRRDMEDPKWADG